MHLSNLKNNNAMQQMPIIIRTNSFVFVNYTTIPECDSRILWQARNDDRIRCQMETEEKFSWESHCCFVESLRRRYDTSYYAVYQRVMRSNGGGGVIASQCLNPIDWKNAEAESGQYLLPEYQGNGYGTLMKKEFFEWLFDNGFQKIKEKVKLTNTRNQHINEKLGMLIYAKDEKYIYYEKTDRESVSTYWNDG